MFPLLLNFDSSSAQIVPHRATHRSIHTSDKTTDSSTAPTPRDCTASTDHRARIVTTISSAAVALRQFQRDNSSHHSSLHHNRPCFVHPIVTTTDRSMGACGSKHEYYEYDAHTGNPVSPFVPHITLYAMQAGPKTISFDPTVVLSYGNNMKPRLTGRTFPPRSSRPAPTPHFPHPLLLTPRITLRRHITSSIHYSAQ